MDEKRYMALRKKGLRKMQELVYSRTKINNELNRVRRELDSWDRALIAEEE